MENGKINLIIIDSPTDGMNDILDSYNLLEKMLLSKLVELDEHVVVLNEYSAFRRALVYKDYEMPPSLVTTADRLTHFTKLVTDFHNHCKENGNTDYIVILSDISYKYLSDNILEMGPMTISDAIDDVSKLLINEFRQKNVPDIDVMNMGWVALSSFNLIDIYDLVVDFIDNFNTNENLSNINNSELILS